MISIELKSAALPSGLKLWRTNMSDNTLLPTPVSVIKMTSDELKRLYELFSLAGILIAKSIADDRLIDLPMSNLFWDLLLGKVNLS